MNEPQRAKVTMLDVAKHAKVSRTTVSFVLSGNTDAGISEETRLRVQQAVSVLGYRPNASARALASKESKLYGLITEIVTGPYAMDIVRGAQEQAAQDGRMLLIASTDGTDKSERKAIDMMLEHQVAGLMYATAWHRGVSLPDTISEVPAVLVHCFDQNGKIPSITPDEKSGGHVAAMRLIDAGHRRIGMINLDPTIPAAIGRREGYILALTQSGIAPDERLIINAGGEADQGYRAAAALLDDIDPPTAIFCATDRMAMGAYDAIKERGLVIGEDVSVIGFDNQELISNYLRPSLTTVALPFREMAALGIRSLAQIAPGENSLAYGTPVNCSLVERSSVGAPLRPH